VRLLVPGARLRDVRPMGTGDAHARFSLESGARRALGVAFGVNGELAAAAEAGALDASVSLEVNVWNGAVEPRVVLGQIYRAECPEQAPGTPDQLPGDDEWLARFRSELEAPLEDWPPRKLTAIARGGRRRSVVDRRAGSGLACVAALTSSGEPVLILCADALRRRALVESAVVPARFGGGSVALLGGALSDEAIEERVRSLLADEAGVALADWAALGRHPLLPQSFDHIVVIDPPPFAHLEDLADRVPNPDPAGPSGRARAVGGRFLHLAWSDATIELALQVHELEWPLRPALARLYREIVRASDEGRTLGGQELAATLAGAGRFPRTPESAARCVRVMVELELLRWEPSGTREALGVVSSESKDLERSGAFVAYRDRFEEGRRFLSGRRQAS
jgi:single-stranded-DNA-specific exonuclease